MKCGKDNLVVIGLFVAVLTIVTGVMSDRINSVEAELDNRAENNYSIPHIQEDISEIKQDIRDIKEILIEDYSK